MPPEASRGPTALDTWSKLPPDLKPIALDSSTAWFTFEVDGIEIGTFRSVSGLAVSMEVHQYSEGGQNGFVHTFPGRLTWPNLTFSRGLVVNDALLQWVLDSQPRSGGTPRARFTGAVTAVDRDANPLRSWSLYGVVPVRWTGPSFDVTSDGDLVEQLEVAHQGFVKTELDGGA